MSEVIRKDWAKDIVGPELPLLEKPCSDCPVTCGFYLPYSRGLALESKEVQLEVSKRWFCHDNPGNACRGNWNFLKLRDLSGERF
jgi:hypothetical protein